MKLYLTIAIDHYEPVIYDIKAFLERKAALEHSQVLKENAAYEYSIRVEEVDCAALDDLLRTIAKKLDERTVYQSLEESTWLEFQKQIEWLALYNQKCGQP